LAINERIEDDARDYLKPQGAQRIFYFLSPSLRALGVLYGRELEEQMKEEYKAIFI